MKKAIGLGTAIKGSLQYIGNQSSLLSVTGNTPGAYWVHFWSFEEDITQKIIGSMDLGKQKDC